MHRRTGEPIFVLCEPGTKMRLSWIEEAINSPVDPRLDDFIDEAICSCEHYDKRFFAELPDFYKQDFFARFIATFKSSMIELYDGFVLVCSEHHLLLMQNRYIVSHDPREIKRLTKDLTPSKEDDSRDLSDLVKDFLDDYGAACVRQEEERFCDLSVHCRAKLHKKFLELFGSESVGVYFNIYLVCTEKECCLVVQSEECPLGVRDSNSFRELEDNLASLFQWEVFRDEE